jgi:hypothetical protein
MKIYSPPRRKQEIPLRQVFGYEINAGRNNSYFLA